MPTISRFCFSLLFSLGVFASAAEAIVFKFEPLPLIAGQPVTARIEITNSCEKSTVDVRSLDTINTVTVESNVITIKSVGFCATLFSPAPARGYRIPVPTLAAGTYRVRTIRTEFDGLVLFDSDAAGPFIALEVISADEALAAQRVPTLNWISSALLTLLLTAGTLIWLRRSHREGK